MTAPATLVLEGIDKRFAPPPAAPVLSGLSLEIAGGEVLALLGPSGSGKTTVLRTVAGFETPDRGRVVLGGEDVTRLPPERRNFGMVFQHYALFPHLSVGGNVAFGLAGRGLPKDAIAQRVDSALALVDLAGYAGRRVGEISGGQQQRVALARALAPEPRILLLDEPLSNLDPALRERTRRELKRAIERVSITTLLVTHEQEEAFHLGDRVAVLYRGVLQQVGTPEELYQRPATRFVATFVGRSSALAGRFAPAGDGTGQGGRGTVTLGGVPGAPAWEGIAAEPLAPGDPAEIVIRPESLALVPMGTAGAGAPPALRGRVVERRYGGPFTAYHVAVEGMEGEAGELEVLAGADAAAPGDLVAVAPNGTGPAPRIFRRPVFEPAEPSEPGEPTGRFEPAEPAKPPKPTDPAKPPRPAKGGR
jgi:ABC-type Fe3+/spermidine/putrescine transport system ATPase subunit